MPKKKWPHNTNAEEAVLGAMIENLNVRNEALSQLTEDDFYEENKANRYIFNAISHLADSSVTIDITSLADELLTNMKVLQDIGGIPYLIELQESFIGEKNALHHLSIVKDLGLARRLLKKMDELSNEFNEKEIKDVSQFVAEAESQILDITRSRRVGSLVYSQDVAKRIIDKLKINQGRRGLLGVSTGYRKLDAITDGFERGDLIYLAARPSVGKTALSINLAYNAASVSRVPVAFFSLEMTAELVVERLLAARSQIIARNIRNGIISDTDWMALSEAVEALKRVNILIDDTSAAKITDIRTKIQKLKAEYNDLGLVVIDYLGLIRTNNTKLDQHQIEIGEISRTLKAIAKENNVAILCLCQLSRASEKRTDRKPMLTDLRDSGSLEQDADKVLFIYRKDYQNNEEGQQEKKENKEEDLSPFGNASETEILVQKNRNGKTGDVKLTFYKNISRFVEIEESSSGE